MHMNMNIQPHEQVYMERGEVLGFLPLGLELQGSESDNCFYRWPWSPFQFGHHWRLPEAQGTWKSQTHGVVWGKGSSTVLGDGLT